MLPKNGEKWKSIDIRNGISTSKQTICINIVLSMKKTGALRNFK